MRVTLRLLATPSGAGIAKGLQAAPMALLPPLPLYRRLLRGHRKFLPQEMRVLGDQYIKKEFRDHKSTENPMHIVRRATCFLFQLLTTADRVPYRVANVRPAGGRRFLEGREAGQGQNR